jgi:aarF domain-containing kinase
LPTLALLAMSGKRLLDLISLFNASRGVAQKHFALRSDQLDVYNRTSTLARAVRNQTSRVTETARAASVLVSRLNESQPQWASEASSGDVAAQSNDAGPIPSRWTTEAKTNRSPQKQKIGLEQDHFYERSKRNTALDKHPTSNLDVQQEKAARYPLPDGTIPPKESDLNTPDTDHESFSTRAKNEGSKKPLINKGFSPVSSNAGSIPLPNDGPPSPAAVRKLQRESEHQIPSMSTDAVGKQSADSLEGGHDKESFYEKSGHTSPVLSSLPRMRIPKFPSNTQSKSSNLSSGRINSDSFYNVGETQKDTQIPAVEAVPEQEQIPEGVNTDLFHSPRVARMLGGNIQGTKRKGDLKLQGSENTPVDNTNLAANKDQESFSVHSLSQKQPSTLETNAKPPYFLEGSVNAEEDSEKLAKDESKGIETEPFKV